MCLTRFRRIPKLLRTYEAYTELKDCLDNFSECIPLLKMMCDKCMKSRHWKKLEGLLECKLDVEDPSFKLRNIMERNLLKVDADIEV